MQKMEIQKGQNAADLKYYFDIYFFIDFYA